MLKYSPFLFEFSLSQTFYCLIYCIHYFRTGSTRNDIDNVIKQENKVLSHQCKQCNRSEFIMVIMNCEKFSAGQEKLKEGSVAGGSVGKVCATAASLMCPL